MIKIITGHSSYGGSTTAFINLTNLFNKNGIECKLYGPHEWHLNKCNADMFNNFRPEPHDRVIVHFLNINERIPSEVVILSVHEQNVFKIKDINLDFYDKIHFVSEHQRQYHGVDKDSFIIQNVLDDLKKNPKPLEKIAGIIGTVDPNKNVHISIANALKMGFKKIKIYGNISNQSYFREKVEPYVKAYKNIVSLEGFCEDKQAMYDSVTDVFVSSEMETWSYVIGECRITGTNLHTIKGKNYVENFKMLNNKDILLNWKDQLKL